MADLTPSEQEPIIDQLRSRFDYASREWADIRAEGKVDIRCVSGDVWDPKERAKRDDAGRPCLSLDELGQYVNQLINEVRQHKRAIKVTALGSGESKAKEARARLRANLIRQIEYRSNAQSAYTTMFENTVQRSYGFMRIKARYEHPRSIYQELVIEPVDNPDMVTPDPDDLSPVGADMKYAFVHEWWGMQEFHRRWPSAKVRGKTPEYAKDAPKWWNGERIQVAEYWTVESEERELLYLQTQDRPVAIFADELEPPADDANPRVQKRWLQRFGMLAESYRRGQAQVLDRRVVDYPCVYQYMTNGIELLAPDPIERPKTLKLKWLGTSIPIIACYGKVLWVDNGTSSVKEGQILGPNDGSGSKRVMMSLVRLARDPAMLYCYYRTCEAELVGMTPKTPFVGYVGQFRTRQDDWAKVNHEPLAYLEADATTEKTGGQILPLPQRQPYDPAIQPLEMGAESARRAIQAAMGISPLPTQAQRKNDKSGVALQEIRSSEQQGSFHFVDHYEMSITEGGKKLDELLPYYYDSARDVTVRTPADEAESVRINDPAVVDEESGEPLMLRPEDIHDVTLSTGPSQDSERQAASDFADTLAQSPEIFQVIGDLVVKLKNLGPIGDEISERLSALQPPQVQALKDAKKQNPAALMAQLDQAKQMIEMLSKELQAKTQAIETDAVKAERDVKVETAKAETDAQVKSAELASKERIEMRKLEVELEIEMAKLGSAQAMARAEVEQQDLHHHDEMQQREQDRGVQMAESDLNRQAERDEAEAKRGFEAEQADANRAVEQSREAEA